jgi:hypothetical protein
MPDSSVQSQDIYMKKSLQDKSQNRSLGPLKKAANIMQSSENIKDYKWNQDRRSS